jgi:hypothetical protein
MLCHDFMFFRSVDYENTENNIVDYVMWIITKNIMKIMCDDNDWFVLSFELLIQFINQSNCHNDFLLTTLVWMFNQQTINIH